MAQYTARYSCGHTETVRLFGKETERQSHLSRLRDRLCRTCYAEANPEPPTAYLCQLEGRMELGIIHGFAIKDQLKERGYRFGAFEPDPGRWLSRALDPVHPTLRERKAWCKFFAPEQIEGEIVALSEMGVGFEMAPDSPWNVVLRALIEGRPDLLP